jgi:hypothetical protein
MTEVRAALSRAVTAVTGRTPNKDTLDVLSAQVSLETAHGGAMYNFNFGGIKGASPSGDTAHYLTHEVLGGKDVTLQQGFRAYSSLDAGAKDYVAVLQSRFPGAFGQAMAGNLDGFAHALHQAHYYTASEKDYTSGLRAAAGLPAKSTSATSTAVASLDGGGTPYSTSADLSRVLDAIAASATRIADPDPQT